VIRIDVATAADSEALLASAEALVAADAGRFDPDGTDLGWRARSGAAYAADALAGDNLVLLARDGDTVAGHLVGRLLRPGAVHPIRRAELESIHVYPAYRGVGLGSRLVEMFLAWGAANSAGRASVTAYAANEPALRFYARHGFAARSIIADRLLDPTALADS